MQTQNLKRLVWLVAVVVVLSGCNKNKVKCTGETDKTYAATGFNKVTIGDNFNVTITKGNVFSVKAKGCTENINDLNVAVSTGGNLNVQYNPTNLVHNKALYIFITLPQLLELNASAAAKTSITGLENQTSDMRIVLSGAAECIVSKAAAVMTFALSGASVLNITGASDKLIGQLDGASRISAYNLASKYTDINASGASRASVTAQDKLYIEASGASEIRYKGNPPVIHTDVSGGAKIIKE